jgi:hypothetical protein
MFKVTNRMCGYTRRGQEASYRWEPLPSWPISSSLNGVGYGRRGNGDCGEGTPEPRDDPGQEGNLRFTRGDMV